MLVIAAFVCKPKHYQNTPKSDEKRNTLKLEFIEKVTLKKRHNDADSVVLSSDQIGQLVEKWNYSEFKGLYKMTPKYWATVHLKNDSTRYFRVNKDLIKENSDWTYSLNDSLLIDSFWASGHPISKLQDSINLSVSRFDLTSKQFNRGDVYVLNPHDLFGLAQWKIKPESYAQLDSITLFLVKNDSLFIEIGVHSDSRGSDHFSMSLEGHRAESIANYLIEKGVDSNRLSAKGYGDYNLLISDSEIEKMETNLAKEEAHAVNRRVEFKIIDIKTKGT